jgi:sigma-E factor negative regulatory protein RseB
MASYLRQCLPLVLAGLLPLVGVAAPVDANPVSAADARSWLARIHAAAERANYQGTMVVSADGLLSSTRVWHYQVGDQRYEKREALDGRQRQVLRHNEAVHTLWPQARVVMVETQRLLPVQPGTPAAVEPRALEQYQLRHQGQGRVAGREAEVFLLEPRDGLRYAQRLWADRSTGLMLRADIIGPQRTTLESAAFSEIEIGVRAQPETVLRDIKRLEGYRVLPSKKQRTDLEAEGWSLRRPVAGFVPVGCVKRPLRQAPAGLPPAPLTARRTLPGTNVGNPASGLPVDRPAGGVAIAPTAIAADDGADEQVLQAVFSDGLTHVSLFIEPYREDRHRDTVRARVGATSTVMQRRGAHWITSMGDVPEATLQLFADGLELRR